jgi:alkanesulfonate monooxygenase SsuD/methylene tetrahydromethanopterin reductase-like flavin-dependent oxidoreductase (luciferase family)
MSHHGRFFKVDNLSVVPKPVQKPHPPIRTAANSVETFELMGRMGYPIFVATPINPFPKLREYLPLYRRARKSAGHPDRGGEDVTLALPVYVGENRAQIRQAMEPSLNHYLQTVAAIQSSHASQSSTAATTLSAHVGHFRRTTYEQACEAMAIFDTPEVCLERLQHLREEFNVGRVICWFNIGGMLPHAQVMRSMELFAAKVMPHL